MNRSAASCGLPASATAIEPAVVPGHHGSHDNGVS